MRFIFLCLLLPVLAAAQTPFAPDAATKQKIQAMLARMTPAEKAGQMTQLALDMISVSNANGGVADPHQVDTAKLRKVIQEYRVGSILDVAGHTITREHWAEILGAIDKMTAQTPGALPVLYGVDAVHGANYVQGSTLFPQEIALAATWNPSLAREMGRITAYETRASGVPWVFSPELDVCRTPVWPRIWETFGEDPYLVSEFGRELTYGFQGSPAELGSIYTVAACMKHFLGYGFPITGHDRTPAWVPERQLREYFLPPFEAAIAAGAPSIMINSGETNGIPVHSDYEILTTLLRKELGFQGVAVTDWADIKGLVERHHVAKDYREAIKMAINAGIDMSMVPTDLEFTPLLTSLIESGEIPMARVDEAVGRILAMKLALGMFADVRPTASSYPDFGSEKHIAASYQTAIEAITLLKNDKNILPLAKNNRVLVTGPVANSLNALNGGWTHTWQGQETKYNTPGKLTLLQAIEAKVGKALVKYVPGTTIDSVLDIAAAVKAAKSCDVIVACIGEMPYTERPGNIDLLDLPQAQQQLIKALAATGKPIVLVLLEGRPRIIREIEPLTKAVAQGYLPGNEGGRAIADVLFGDQNPSGKLPYTYPRFANDLVLYDHKYSEAVDAGDYNPQWPFGFGLSYTTFAYSDITLSSAQITADKPLKVSVTVTNSGQQAGSEVVQCYTSDLVASVTPSVKRLRKFEKISLKPGESRTVTFTLTVADLSFVNRQNKRVTESGDFTVEIGGKKATFTLP